MAKLERCWCDRCQATHIFGQHITDNSGDSMLMIRCAVCGYLPCACRLVLPGTKLTRSDVSKLVDDERDFQDQKHGSLSAHGHTVGEWILIMESELAEAKLAILKGGTGRNRVMHEILQVVATGIAALEQHGIDELSSKWGDR